MIIRSTMLFASLRSAFVGRARINASTRSLDSQAQMISARTRCWALSPLMVNSTDMLDLILDHPNTQLGQHTASEGDTTQANPLTDCGVCRKVSTSTSHHSHQAQEERYGSKFLFHHLLLVSVCVYYNSFGKICQPGGLFEQLVEAVAEHLHLAFFHVEVCSRIVVLTLFVVIIQHPTGEVERSFKTLTWAILDSHHVCFLKYSVAHRLLLVSVCVYYNALLPKGQPL